MSNVVKMPLNISNSKTKFNQGTQTEGGLESKKIKKMDLSGKILSSYVTKHAIELTFQNNLKSAQK